MATPHLAPSLAQARSAVIETLPLFEMARMRAATSARRHAVHGFAGEGAGTTWRWVNQFTHTRRLLGPTDREVVTPNNDTLYTNAWLDLSQGPLVLHVPAMDDRYWTLGFLDAWTNPWASAGRRTTGGQAQQIFVHGPTWQGTPPEGMQVVRAPGDDVWIIGRLLVDGEADLAEVHRLQDRFAIRRPDGSAAVSRVDAWLDGRPQDMPDPVAYAAVVDAMLARNPARAQCHWPVPLADLAQALGPTFDELRRDVQPARLSGGWSTAMMVRTDFGDDVLTRARVARNWIGTLGIEEAMYLMAETDADGQPLNGASRYRLRFSPGAEVQVDAFWSLTLYRSSDRLLVDNPIARYSIGDRTPGLQRDVDGGLTLAIQADDPGPGVNWLPSPPAEAFYLTLRLYQPRQAHLTQQFAYPPVTRMG